MATLWTLPSAPWPWWCFIHWHYPDGFGSGSAIEAPWFLFAAEAASTHTVFDHLCVFLYQLLFLFFHYFFFFPFVRLHWLDLATISRVFNILDFFLFKKIIRFVHTAAHCYFCALSLLVTSTLCVWLSPSALASPFLSLAACLFSSHSNCAVLRLPTITTSFPLFPASVSSLWSSPLTPISHTSLLICFPLFVSLCSHSISLPSLLSFSFFSSCVSLSLAPPLPFSIT